MFPLSAQKRLDLYEIYKREKYFFPIIGSVLLGKQKGIVFSISEKSSSFSYVEHKFGFAQIIGHQKSILSTQLNDYLFENKKFKVPKVRLYNSKITQKELSYLHNVSVSERQHFQLNVNNFNKKAKNLNFNKFDIQPVTKNNIRHLHDYGIIDRFWKSEIDFIKNSFGIIVFDSNKMISYCYSAGNANGFSEIDVFTHEDYRRKGVAKISTYSFIKRLLENDLMPYWDCYTNNAGSVKLAQSIGFKPLKNKYSLLTISK